MSHSPPAATRRRRERTWRVAVGVTIAAWLVRLLFAARLPLFPDETYYWDWSRHLAGGYFDHPPMIALLIRAGTALAALFGAEPTPVGDPLLRRCSPAPWPSLAAAATARRIGGDRAAVFAALAFALMPLAAAGLVLATPDAPLLVLRGARRLRRGARAAVSAALGRARSAGGRRRASALGLAFASKYTSILLPLSLVVAVLVRPSLRERLREPGPYVACVLATLVFLPVLQLERDARLDLLPLPARARARNAEGLGVERELDLVGGQLGLVTPILFALVAAAVWRALRRPRDDAHFALAVVATGSWVFFVYSAIHRRVEANWPAPSYVAGVALLASMLATSASASLDRWWRGGLALAAIARRRALPARRACPCCPSRRGATRSRAARVGWSRAAHVVAVRRARRRARPGSAPSAIRT